MSMDRNRNLFSIAVPRENGETLFMLKEPRRCPDCGNEVYLVIETATDMPRCVACAESKRLDQTTEGVRVVEVKRCSACTRDHSLRPWAFQRSGAGERFFHCPTNGEHVFIHTT